VGNISDTVAALLLSTEMELHSMEIDIVRLAHQCFQL